MDAFLSTLIQTTAALIAILLAAMTAYYVFLQSKSAEYDDKIQAEKAGIRADIVSLQAQWPSTIVMFLPPEFKERLSAHTGNLHGAQLVNRIAISMTFPRPEVLSALADVRPYDSFDQQHWQGRVYFLGLDEALKVISVGASLAPTTFSLGQAEPRTDPLGAFPRSPTGPGFKEWRNDFDQISTADRFLESQVEFAVADFKAFLDSQPYAGNRTFLDLYAKAVRAFHSSIGSIRSHVRNIDGLELVQSRYSFHARVNGLPLLLLIILASLIGTIVPLFVMAGLGSKITPVAACAILIATLALVIGAFVQFGRDVFRPLTDDPKLYVAERWVRPLLEELAHDSGNIESGSTVSVEHVSEFMSSSFIRELPSPLIDSLKRYEAIATAYNASAQEVDASVLQRMQKDAEFQPFRRPYAEANKRQHSSLHPTDLVDSKKMEQIRSMIGSARDVFLGVETATYWGSRGRLALMAPPRRREAFLKALDKLSESSSSTAEAKAFLKHRQQLPESASQLREGLTTFLRR